MSSPLGGEWVDNVESEVAQGGAERGDEDALLLGGGDGHGMDEMQVRGEGGAASHANNVRAVFEDESVQK